MSILDVTRIHAVVNRRCKEAGVKVRWDRYAKTAMTNGHLITLPAIAANASEDALNVTYGYVIHECGHHSRPEAFDILKQAKPPATLAALFNITEDDGMERDIASRHKGDAKALGVMNRLLNERDVLEWIEVSKDPDFTIDDFGPVAATALGHISRADWDNENTRLIHQFLNAFPEDCTKLIQQLVEEGWVDKFRETETPKDTWNLACDLMERLYELDDEQKQELQEIRANGNAAADGDPLPHPNRAKKQQPTGDKGEGEGDTDDDDKQGLDGVGQGGLISWKSVQHSEHDWQEENKQGNRKGGKGIDWTGFKSTANVFVAPAEALNIVDLSDPKHQVWGGNRYDSFGKPECFQVNDTRTRILANQMRRYMQARSRVRHNPEQYEGNIDKRNLIRLTLPPVDGGEWNKKVFYNKSDHHFLNTAIHILVDWSGSMVGDPMAYAADAAGQLVLVCDRVLRMPTQIAAFTDRYSTCDIGIIKRFNDRSVNAETIAQRFSKFYKYSTSNNDADALNWAYNELKKRREPRKLLVVFSDGAPVRAWMGHPHQNLQHVAAQIDADKSVELYGIGICSEAPANYYKNFKIINSPDCIGPTLLDMVKEGDK